MIIKIVYNEQCESFKDNIIETLKEFPTLKVEIYNEDNYKEKKKAILVKSACGARLNPFSSIYNDKGELIKAFYTEVGLCTVNDIIKYLNELRRNYSVE